MKELEIEYKKQIELELPDLWSRIESGVDAYEASKNNDINKDTTKVVEFSNINSKIEETTSNKKVSSKDEVTSKKKNRKVLVTIGKVVAAAASLFLVVNVISMFGGVKTNDSTSTVQSFAPMADSAATADEAACESAAPEIEESAMAEESASAMEEIEESAEEAYDDFAAETMTEAENATAGVSVSKDENAGMKADSARGESATELIRSDEAKQLLVERLACTDEEANEMVLILQSIGAVEVLEVLSYKEDGYAVYIIDNDGEEHVYTMHTETVDGKVVVSDICESDNSEEYLYKKE